MMTMNHNNDKKSKEYRMQQQQVYLWLTSNCLTEFKTLSKEKDLSQ